MSESPSPYQFLTLEVTDGIATVTNARPAMGKAG